MRFRFTQKKTLPRSAWLAHLKKDDATIEVFHGSSVEQHDDFFVEGAWDGDFGQGDILEANTLLGSGARIGQQSITFAAPSHIYERLYSMGTKKELFVSNSLPFLLSLPGEELDEAYPDYAQTLYRRYGITESDRSIPTRARNRIRLSYYTNLVVYPSLEIKKVAKKETSEFVDFGSYRNFLESSVSSIFENANDSRREVLYGRPIVAISTGYDSTATAVLASRIGCRDALAFRKARPLCVDSYRGGEDSGKEIAEFLGMKCQEFDRLDYLTSKRQLPEAEIFATSHLVDLNVLSLEPRLDESCVLFTGYRGDVMWDRHLNLNQDSGGPGMAEFRLRSRGEINGSRVESAGHFP